MMPEAGYREQVAALQAARRGVVHLVTSEKRLELEARTLAAAERRCAAAAAAAAGRGDDDRAEAERAGEADVMEQRRRIACDVAALRARRVELEDLTERIRQCVTSFLGARNDRTVRPDAEEKPAAG